MKHGSGKWILACFVVSMLSGCATGKPLSEKTFHEKYPRLESTQGEDTAHITFSSDKKYESKEGVPFAGDPIICRSDGVFRVNSEDTMTSSFSEIDVKAGEEIAVTSVITFHNGNFSKTCWPFVAFTPKAGARYIVVNERIGGKGLSAMWTGMAFQRCDVSVFRELDNGPQRIPIRKTSRCQPMKN
jgi:hypothetical protein